MDRIYDIPVHISEHTTVSRWVFPKDRFIEYGPEDERSCRYFGIGHEVREPGMYRVGNSWLIHPQVWKAIKSDLDVKAEAVANDIIMSSPSLDGLPRFAQGPLFNQCLASLPTTFSAGDITRQIISFKSLFHRINEPTPFRNILNCMV